MKHTQNKPAHGSSGEEIPARDEHAHHHDRPTDDHRDAAKNKFTSSAGTMRPADGRDGKTMTGSAHEQGEPLPETRHYRGTPRTR